ncbi:MAG: WG repeat-containing protein [Haliscomenobacter sp.]|nr:WG repeat-containing protein [Haliscomenobacter sp.]MBK9491177.1 WG repeat-containing protein [Haliscomenobacter sp.]
MKNIKFFLFLVCSFCLCSSNNGQHNLLKIIENQRYGYIDMSGKKVIPPIYHNLGEYKEGLIAVRENGLFGYIDMAGKYQIEPRFEYATAFSQGLALVYDQGFPYFINKQGEKVISSIGEAMSSFEYGVAHVFTSSGKVGLIDSKGSFVLDTLYDYIGSFDQGVAVVSIHKKDFVTRYDAKYGVIDSTGKFIVPFGFYAEIEGFNNGLAKVVGKRKDWQGLIDRKGKLILRISKGELDLYNIDQLERIQVLLDQKVKKDDLSSLYHGFVNKKGELVINNPANRWVTSFSKSRAFVHENDLWHLVDTNGTKVHHEAFDEVLDGIFVDGITWVKRKESSFWESIDQTGRTLFKSNFKAINRIPNSDLLMYNDPFLDEKSESLIDRFGLASANGAIITSAIYAHFDRNGYQNGALLVIEDERYMYITQDGKSIWQEPKHTQNCVLNIDYMLRGSFYAASERHPSDNGGFAKNDNSPQAIHAGLDFEEGLSISIRQNQSITEDCHSVLFISNLSSGDQYFNAQDGRLYMKLQAKDSAGQWRDIEYLPSSWCGNSYHTLILRSQTYWSFPMPSFEGSFSTVLRAELKVIDPTDMSSDKVKREYTIYSHEFQGALNPAQFWRKLEYSPLGLMDPYVE